MQPVASPAFLTTAPASALPFASKAPDESSGLWRKAAGGATVAGPAAQVATPAAKRAPFTTLLDSLVSAADTSATGDTAAVKKEDGTWVAFWMAVVSTTPQVSHPAKLVDSAAETGDEAPTNDSLASESAATPETSGDAAAIENAAADAKPAVGAAGWPPETACQTVVGAEANLPRTAGARPAVGSTQSGNQATTEQATAASLDPTGDARDIRRPLTIAALTGAGPSGRPVGEGLRESSKTPDQILGGSAAKSQRAQDVARAGTEIDPAQPPSARSVARARRSAKPAPAPGTEIPQGAAEQQAVANSSDGWQALSAASMVPPQTQLTAALPAAGQPPVKAALRTEQGATGKNGAPGAETLTGPPLAAPAAAEQAVAVSRPDARTVQSVADPEMVAAAGEAAANSTPAASELPDDAAGSSAARPMKLAFAVRLRPVEAAPEESGGEPANGAGEPVKTALVSDQAPAAGETAPGGQENSRDASTASARQTNVDREPVRKPEVSTAAEPEPAVMAHPATTSQPLAASAAQPRESAPASPPPAVAAAPVAAAPESPKPAAARDIKLELAGQGDQRVEVRVSERAGAMRVEVRTPDSGLAGDLRQDLPALAARLEQTGFRADTWHSAGAAERQRTAEAAPGSASQNSERQPGQNGGQRQRDPQQQPKPRTPENQAPSQNAGKDFAWLFSTIQ